MKIKPVVIVLSVLMALILLAGTFSAGFVTGHVLSTPSGSSFDLSRLPVLREQDPSPTLPSQPGAPQDRQELFKAFWQTWDLVNSKYVKQPVDQTAMMRGAIKGMLESLGDEHTSYLDPVMYQAANAQLQGEEYTGIGAWVDTSRKYLTIISPMPDSPAEKAGLKPNDQIIAIDGVDMTGVTGEVARQKVLGPDGSIVRLTIQRGDLAPFDVSVTRAAIKAPSVDSRILVGNVAYVHLFTFGDKTIGELQSALKNLMPQKPVGLILDLRNNGGGYLDTAIQVASQFIPDGTLMYEQYADGSKETLTAQSGGLATQIPIVVLVNEGTASASEIVAGAIQDRGRGRLVGVTTYGKGSVQTYVGLVDQQGAVRVTVAYWLTPNGRLINKLGLTPDVSVPLTDQDLSSGQDSQLAKAVELLTQK